MQTEIENIISKIKVRDYHNVSHMSFTKFHLGMYIGYFDCEGMALHGVQFTHETRTNKNKHGEFGKQQNTYYLSNKKDSPSFKSNKELVEYYICNPELL